MTPYEILSIAIAGGALILAIREHKRVTEINVKIQYIQKLTTSGEQSPIISTSGGQSPIISTSGGQSPIILTSGGQALIISGSDVKIYQYPRPDNKTP